MKTTIPTRGREFHLPGRSPVYGMNAMAATSMPGATLAAIEVLRAGGNAMDAAVAAAGVLAVIEPQSTGIGGDCFCLYVPAAGGGLSAAAAGGLSTTAAGGGLSAAAAAGGLSTTAAGGGLSTTAATGRVHAMNGSGWAPSAATPDALAALGVTTLDPSSPHSVTIPGAVSAWEALLAAHGTKGFDELLRPAIAYAEDGFVVHHRVAADWAAEADKLRRTGAAPFLPNGKTPAAGDIFRQPALAASLRRIAANGARGFYEGETAADIVATLRGLGGLHTEADFAEGTAIGQFVEPIGAPWGGYEVFQCPPNGSGILVLMMLGMLEALGTAPDGPEGPIRLHRHIEAARLVYRDRDAFLADPTQADVPVAHLTDPAYLRGLAALIDDSRALRDLPRAGELALPQHRDTVYLAVVDRDGNACSFINSTFNSFGGGILAERSGVMLQNRGFSFRLEPSHPNVIAPRKRPMHTIIPGMLMKDGRAVMPYGVMGGHFQPMGQTLFLTNFLEYGLDIQQALDQPRVFPFQGLVECERGVPQSTIDALSTLGHTPSIITRPHGGGQAIYIDHARGTLIGGSDPRKDGMALGY